MKNRLLIIVSLSCTTAFFGLSAFADTYSGYTGFSEAFLRDITAAQFTTNSKTSVEYFVNLQHRYTNSAELAELEVQIATCYEQRAETLNPSNAVVHYTAALEYDLPDRGRIRVLSWRGSALVQLGKVNDALKDYLRGLLTCTYYDIPADWPDILGSKVTILMSTRSFDPENSVRAKDYVEYRRQLDFQQFLIMQRYSLIDAVKTNRKGKSDQELIKIMDALSPDSKRVEKIIELINSENKRPWP